jgi:hypothetical protein
MTNATKILVVACGNTYIKSMYGLNILIHPYVFVGHNCIDAILYVTIMQFLDG